MDVKARQKRFRWHSSLVKFYPDWKRISPFFEPEEIYSPTSLTKYPHLIDLTALCTVNDFRRSYGIPLLLNNYMFGGIRRFACIRTTHDNLKVHGALESMHLRAKAFDLAPSDGDVKKLFTTLLSYNVFGALIKYPSFVHVDLRPILAGEPYVEIKKSKS